MAAVPCLSLLDSISNSLASGPLSTAKIILFTNSPTLSESSLYSDLVAPTYSSYSDQSVTFSDVSEDAAGNLVLQSNLLFFQPTNNTNLPQTIYGYALYNHAVSGFPLLLAEFLPAPVNLALSSNSLSLVLQVVTQNALNYGGVIVVPY
jgi:hypothetical protein